MNGHGIGTPFQKCQTCQFEICYIQSNWDERHVYTHVFVINVFYRSKHHKLFIEPTFIFKIDVNALFFYIFLIVKAEKTASGNVTYRLPPFIKGILAFSGAYKARF
jgi:hypothetical protein